MSSIRVLLASFVFTAFSLNSCGDNGNPLRGGKPTSSIPNQIGMLWVYEVYDSLAQTTDTVSVSITDTVVAGVRGLRWRTYSHSDSSVSEKISVIRGDTLDFVIDTTSIAPPLERFVFPLSLGSQWNVSPGVDLSEVTRIGTVSVPAGQFIKSAIIKRNWNYDLEGGHDSSLTWIAPDVGIVSRYFHRTITDGGGNFFITMSQTWELIDYDLNTFSMNQFPGASGSQWVYEIVGNWFVNPETVTVTIANNFQIPGFDSTKLWLISGNMITDTYFVAYVNDQVWVSEDTLMSSLWDWRYEFPLSVGRHWGSSPFASAPRIYSKTSITTPAGTFPSAFQYSMGNGAVNIYWSVQDWLVPEVGVVKRTYSLYDFGPIYTQEWTLLSYNLK